MQFTVFYAGAPESTRSIRARSPKEAAFAYFAPCMYRNSIIVKTGLMSEAVFSWRDFASRIPNLDESRLLYLRPRAQKGKRTFVDDIIENVVKGPYRTWDWTDPKQ